MALPVNEPLVALFEVEPNLYQICGSTYTSSPRAGSTGAVMSSAVLTLGRKKGISRPALGAIFPFPTGPLLFLDLGANADC